MNICALILAAGLSTRMKKPKPLLKINNLYFVQNLYQLFIKQNITPVIITNIHLYTKINAILPKAQILVNYAPEKGRNSSIRLGLQYCQPNPVFIQNVDSPILYPQTIHILKKHIDPLHVIIPKYNGSTGHPIILPYSAQQKFLAYDPEQIHFRKFIFSLPHKIIPVNDPYITLNINTPEQYQQLLHEI